MNILKRLLPLTLCLLTVGAAHADLIKQSTTYSRTVLMTLSGDHITGATGLTLTVTESKAGAAFGASAATVTEISTGWYKIALTTTDTNALGAFNLHITATGADPTDTADQVVAFDPTDASLLGLTGVGTLANQTTLVAGQATITAKTNLIATNAGDSANQTASQSAITTIQTRLGSPTGASIAADIASQPGLLLGLTAASYNGAGTIGQKINSAGSAGNPWTTDISTGYTGTQAGALLYAIRSGQPMTLPTTPPTGYALPGYYYAPVLDSGSAGVTSLVVTVTNPTSSTTSRLISWTVDSLATSYKVMRSTDGINYIKIATTAVGTLSYTDASRPVGTVYYSVISVH